MSTLSRSGSSDFVRSARVGPSSVLPIQAGLQHGQAGVTGRVILPNDSVGCTEQVNFDLVALSDDSLSPCGSSSGSGYSSDQENKPLSAPVLPVSVKSALDRVTRPDETTASPRRAGITSAPASPHKRVFNGGACSAPPSPSKSPLTGSRITMTGTSYLTRKGRAGPKLALLSLLEAPCPPSARRELTRSSEAQRAAADGSPFLACGGLGSPYFTASGLDSPQSSGTPMGSPRVLVSHEESARAQTVPSVSLRNNPSAQPCTPARSRNGSAIELLPPTDPDNVPSSPPFEEPHYSLIDLSMVDLLELINSTVFYNAMAESPDFWRNYYQGSFSTSDTPLLLFCSNDYGEINYQRAVAMMDSHMDIYKPYIDTTLKPVVLGGLADFPPTETSLLGNRTPCVSGNANQITASAFHGITPSIPATPSREPIARRVGGWLGGLVSPRPPRSVRAGSVEFGSTEPPRTPVSTTQPIHIRAPPAKRPVIESIDKAVELGLDVWLSRHDLSVYRTATGAATPEQARKRLNAALLSGSLACVKMFVAESFTTEHLNLARISGSVEVYRYVRSILFRLGCTVEVENPDLLFSICCARDDVVSFRRLVNINPLTFYRVAVQRAAQRILRALCDMLSDEHSVISADPRNELFDLAIQCNNLPALRYLAAHLEVSRLTLRLSYQSVEVLTYLDSSGRLHPQRVSLAQDHDISTREWFQRWLRRYINSPAAPMPVDETIVLSVIGAEE